MLLSIVAGALVGASRKYTPWGTVAGTGAASIDLVLLDATRPLSIGEIEDEIRERGLPERGAVSSHLNTLKKRGYVINTPAGWCRVEMATGYKPAPASPKRAKSPASPSDPPPSPSESPEQAAARTEKLKRVKVAIEIGTAVISLIGAVIALVWKFK